MPLSYEYVKKVKTDAHFATIASTRDANAKAPLIALYDGMRFHFLGEDADKVKAVVGRPSDEPRLYDGVSYYAIDSRVWNNILPVINEAGHEVSVTDVPK